MGADVQRRAHSMTEARCTTAPSGFPTPLNVRSEHERSSSLAAAPALPFQCIKARAASGP
jgi:hypothetical protein